MTDRLSAPLDDFKERELEILNLMAEGLSNQEIADCLFITKGTVRWYNKQIYSKLGTSRRTEAIALARTMGLIGNLVQDETQPQRIQHKLPVTTGPFIGRDDDVAHLLDLLNTPAIRLISLVATGGMGKSRLTLEVGQLVKSHYAHGVAFIDLTTLRNPDDIATHTLSSLGLPLSDNQSPTDVVLDYCRDKSLLLIFDNFEHVLSGAQFVSDILEHTPQVKIIVTTRERLNLRIETTFYLQPVIEDGRELFIELAHMMHPDFEIEDVELVDVQRIVDLVGGLPLAIILAVAWLDMLSVAEIGAEIDASLDFLSAEMGDMPDRQRSIHAVIDPTWKRLSEKEQKIFMWASVFRGGFTREILQQMTGATLREIQTLLNRSLLSSGRERRYDLHPLIRQYAHEKLYANGLLNDAQQAHLQAFLHYAQHYDGEIKGDTYLSALEVLDLEQDNFRAALDWSFSEHDVETGVALTQALYTYWSNRSIIQEATYYMTQASNHAPNNVQLHVGLAFYNQRLGNNDLAKTHCERAIELAEASQSLEDLANSHRMYAQIILAEISASEALKRFEKALEYAEASGVQKMIAACHVMIGVVLMERGISAKQALSHLQEAQKIYEVDGDLLAISRVIYNMSLIYYNQSDGQQDGRDLCERSADIKRQIGDSAGLARRLSVLARWDILEEEYERARAYNEEARTICKELGERSRLQHVTYVDGLILMATGNYTDAIVAFEQALQLAKEIKDHIAVADYACTLAMLLMVEQQVETVLPLIRQSIAIYQQMENEPWIVIITYCNYLWYQDQLIACLPIVAMLELQIEKFQNMIIYKYFLLPLIYRVQQAIGDKAWREALQQAEAMTIETVFDDIIAELITK